MTTNMAYALQITLIGMSLVFGAIVLLWVLMAVLVRLTTDTTPDEPLSTEAATDADLKRRAAAAAVAIALAEADRSTEVHAFPLPQTALVSAWQAVMRSNYLRERRPR